MVAIHLALDGEAFRRACGTRSEHVDVSIQVCGACLADGTGCGHLPCAGITRPRGDWGWTRRCRCSRRSRDGCRRRNVGVGRGGRLGAGCHDQRNKCWGQLRHAMRTWWREFSYGPNSSRLGRRTALSMVLQLPRPFPMTS